MCKKPCLYVVSRQKHGYLLLKSNKLHNCSKEKSDSSSANHTTAVESQLVSAPLTSRKTGGLPPFPPTVAVPLTLVGKSPGLPCWCHMPNRDLAQAASEQNLCWHVFSGQQALGTGHWRLSEKDNSKVLFKRTKSQGSQGGSNAKIACGGTAEKGG